MGSPFSLNRTPFSFQTLTHTRPHTLPQHLQSVTPFASDADGGIDQVVQIPIVCRSAQVPSALDPVPHACQGASHVSETAYDARHRILGVNLVLQIDEALVLHRDE